MVGTGIEEGFEGGSFWEAKTEFREVWTLVVMRGRCRKSGNGNGSGRTQSRTMSEPSERAASKSALLNSETDC